MTVLIMAFYGLKNLNDKSAFGWHGTQALALFDFFENV